MSTIRVDNFGPSAGGTTYSARGIAKAWVNFDGTGAIAARDSENVSSLTDNGTGNYNVNFTNAFAATNYAPFKADNERGVGEISLTSTGSLSMLVRNTSFSEADASTVTHLAHGDLA